MAVFGGMSTLNGVDDAFGLVSVGLIAESADVIGVFAEFVVVVVVFVGVVADGGDVVAAVVAAVVVVFAAVVVVVVVDPLDF